MHRNTLEKDRSPLHSKKMGCTGGLNRIKSTAALLSVGKKNK
jgi:hypothetical protein